MGRNSVVIELRGDFDLDVDAIASEIDPDQLVDVVVGTGFGAERVLKFISELSQPSRDALRRLMDKIARPNHISNLKITKDGVEIGSFPVESTDQVLELIDATLDKLHGRPE